MRQRPALQKDANSSKNTIGQLSSALWRRISDPFERLGRRLTPTGKRKASKKDSLSAKPVVPPEQSASKKPAKKERRSTKPSLPPKQSESKSPDDIPANPVVANKPAVPRKQSPEQFLKAKGYLLRRQVGKGGYGRVWMAEVPGGDLRALKIVAVKGKDKTAFERECSAMRRVKEISQRNEFLVPIEDVQIHSQRGFLSYTMPLADDATGHPVYDRREYRPRSLETELKRRGKLPVSECVAVAKRVLGALQALHGIGLIHRDIKPSNIIYVRGAPYVADFGLVTHQGPDVSQVASPSNMPPEGVGDRPGDIYAVAILLYSMATGNAAKDFPVVSTEVGDPAFPRLNLVILTAGDKDPAHRYVNAEAMSLALDHVLVDADPRNPEKLPRIERGPIIRAMTRHFADRGHKRMRFHDVLQNVLDATCADLAGLPAEGAFLSPDDLECVAQALDFEVKRRIGHVPAITGAATLLAQATLEPDVSGRCEFLVRASRLQLDYRDAAAVAASAGEVLEWSAPGMRGVADFLADGPETTRGRRKTATEDLAASFGARDAEAATRSLLARDVLLAGYFATTERLMARYQHQLSV